MEKRINVTAFIDKDGMVRSANQQGDLNLPELGLLILEIERSLNQLKSEYFSQVTSTKKELK